MRTIKTITIFSLGLFFLTGCISANPDETPTAQPTDKPSDVASVDIRFTDQYFDGISKFGDLITEDAGTYSVEEIAVAVNNLTSFAKANLDEPYLLSGYWQDDDYLLTGVENSLTFVSDEALALLETNISEASSSAEAREALGEIFLIPNQDLEVGSLCYENWDMTNCRLQEPVFSNLQYGVDSSTGLLNVRIDITVYPLYQGNGGVPVVEERTYKYDAIMSLDNPPVSLGTDIPMFSIKNISSSLVIEGTEELF